MGEIKSVKVDNWGVFFLQKLQNFFNKTDYCDLTLQFRDNSQLKVHRLVLSACTDYFNVLEQTCEVVDDAIIMPMGLQADVVVPIVNFMYTGTLEFELKMYNRLLRTAKDMNMTVLLKLLEAHRRTMEMHPQKNQAPTSPKARRKMPVNISTNVSGGRSLIQPQNRRIVISGNAPQQQRVVQPNTISRFTTTTTSAVANTVPVKQQIGSTTFTRIKTESEQEVNIGGSGGYTLLKRLPQQSTPPSPFEQLRKGYTNNNKRPAATTFISPPAKKPNLEDVKEFAEQQRMRKQIAAEFGDDGDYDAGIMDDDNIHNDDDDDEMSTMPIAQQQQHHQQSVATSSSAAVQTPSPSQQQSEDPPGTTTIIVKHEGPDKPPTIVVKDSSNSKMNHTKIISEVLRQYPHLVNSNKNIKLKIMPNTGGQTQKIVVKKEPIETAAAEKPSNTIPAVGTAKLPTLQKVENKAPPITTAAAVIKPKLQINTNVAQTSGKIPDTATAGTAAAAAPKRRIDSKTMHALIAMGAENTTGPWLCLRCGRNGHPISIPTYRGFRRHLINTHKEVIDAALCEQCGWRSGSKRELHFHMQLEHKIRTNLYIFPQCQLCRQMCIDSDALNQHLIDSHPDENKQQCIYCNKIFPEELQLYTHMKTFHKKQALEDGIIDYSDDENTAPVFPPPDDEEMVGLGEEQESQQQQQQQQPEKKIKILSDISLPISSSIIKADSFSAENVTAGESTTSVASEEYLQEQQEHMETKFVAADGSEVILTDEQRKEILSQLNQENEASAGGVVMVLNENQQFAGGETQSEQGAISQDETSQGTTATNDEPEHDDNQIYRELKSATPGVIEEDTASQEEPEIETGDQEHNDEELVHEGKQEKVQHENMDESKESMDNLEWAENLISEHDLADEVSQPKAEAKVQNVKELEETKEEKYKDDISQKLKELAGEWSEDEDVDEALAEEIEPAKPEENLETIVKETTAEEEDVDVKSPEKEKPDKSEVAEKAEEQDTQKPAAELEPVVNQESEPEEKEKNEDVDVSMAEDDVDLALKNLHKDDNVKQTTDETSEMATEESESVGDLVLEKDKPETVEEKSADIETKTDEDQGEETVDDTTEKLPDGDNTKNDIIDMLLSESAALVSGDTEHDKETGSSDDIKKESVTEKVEQNVESNTEETAEENEFLDSTPKQEEEVNKEVSSTATTSTSDDESNTVSSVPANKEPISSEDHVKSLISEWGDDDDEDDNDTDLTANL